MFMHIEEKDSNIFNKMTSTSDPSTYTEPIPSHCLITSLIKFKISQAENALQQTNSKSEIMGAHCASSTH